MTGPPVMTTAAVFLAASLGLVGLDKNSNVTAASEPEPVAAAPEPEAAFPAWAFWDLEPSALEGWSTEKGNVASEVCPTWLSLILVASIIEMVVMWLGLFVGCRLRRGYSEGHYTSAMLLPFAIACGGFLACGSALGLPGSIDRINPLTTLWFRTSGPLEEWSNLESDMSAEYFLSIISIWSRGPALFALWAELQSRKKKTYFCVCAASLFAIFLLSSRFCCRCRSKKIMQVEEVMKAQTHRELKQLQAEQGQMVQEEGDEALHIPLQAAYGQSAQQGQHASLQENQFWHRRLKKTASKEDVSKQKVAQENAQHEQDQAV